LQQPRDNNAENSRQPRGNGRGYHAAIVAANARQIRGISCGSRKEYIFAATFAANLPRSSREFAENPKQSKFKRFVYENLGQI
jgi:hypothetical protein